ncbi:MAG TPA: FIST C-terminal domain-containing protein, partial [Stenomitos sp.]
MTMTMLTELTPPRVAAVLSAWKEAGERFHVLALLPEGEKEQVPVLQAACREAGLALGGGLFPQLLHEGRVRDAGVLLLKVTDAPPPLLIEDLSREEAAERTCAALAAYVEEQLHEDQDASLFCVFDALVPNIATHLDGWYLRLADRIRYFGVNAGNERFVPEPCLFDGDRFVADGLLVQLLPDHPGACLEHGYGVPPHAITATSATGNRIVQIDWRPALDVYRELMQDEYQVTIDRGNFYSQAVHFPFGILRADGEVLVRIPVALGDEGAIICVGEIPPNSVLTLLDARAGTQQAAAALARDLRELGLPPRQDLLLFYCAGRRMHVGDGLEDELAAVIRETGA